MKEFLEDLNDRTERLKGLLGQTPTDLLKTSQIGSSEPTEAIEIAMRGTPPIATQVTAQHAQTIREAQQKPNGYVCIGGHIYDAKRITLLGDVLEDELSRMNTNLPTLRQIMGELK